MVRLSVILLGNDFVRRRWPTLAVLGSAWALIGAGVFVDALDGVLYFPLHVFGYLLLAEAVVALVLRGRETGTASVLRKARGVGFLVLGLLIVDSHHAASVILAVLFGVAILFDGCFRLAAAVVVRFPGWQLSLLTGLFEIAFALFILEPYPTLYAGTVPYCIGMSVFLTGCVLLRQAFRLKSIQADSPGASADPSPQGRGCSEVLVVHVWTPSGTAENDLINRPLLNRYIAAVDVTGVVSAGHSAVECGSHLYISHYPAVDIDRSANDFVRLLRATPNNDVAGRFLPDYAGEVSDWCASTVQVRFVRYDLERLKLFWSSYQKNTTYNLTRRNCSSAVAHGLEAALQGSMNSGNSTMRDFFRIIMNPEFWLAAQIRKRAEAMAWTPGLVLDYALALNAATESASLGWFSLYAGAKRGCHYLTAAFRGRPVRTIDPSSLPPVNPRDKL